MLGPCSNGINIFPFNCHSNHLGTGVRKKERDPCERTLGHRGEVAYTQSHTARVWGFLRHSHAKSSFSPQSLCLLLPAFMSPKRDLKNQTGPKVAKTFISIMHSTSGRFGQSVCPVQKLRPFRYAKLSSLKGAGGPSAGLRGRMASDGTEDFSLLWWHCITGTRGPWETITAQL